MTPEIPSVQTLAPLIDTIREIAQEELPPPRTMRINLFDDGDYRIYVFHKVAEDERKQIYYEPDSGVVRWQHCKFAPNQERPDPSDIPEGEERVIETEFAFNKERERTTLESPLD